MNQKIRIVISIVASLAVLVLLIGLTVASPPNAETLLPSALFCVLIIFTTAFGVPLAGGRGSLLPMTTAAAFLVLGTVPTAWAAYVGALVHGVIRYRWAERLQERANPNLVEAMGLGAANAAIQTLSILVGGFVYYGTGGLTPLTRVSGSDLPSLVIAGLGYLVVNLFIAGLWFAARGKRILKLYLHSISSVVLYESWPMIFAPLMALVYTQLGLGQFMLMALALIIASLVARGLSLSGQRLERRVKELDSLQAVGQALSASLDLDSILEAIHTQVATLMPARNFYVALHDAETKEVSFPLATEGGERVHWRSRKTGLGLTEYILQTRAPLLITEDYDGTLQALGIDKFGKSATYWLGVPVMAGEEPLGVITVQSYSHRQEYDLSHQEILGTIAAQAAVAIQNARLYARTDEALALRVQELDSILHTTQEGMLRFDLDYQTIAANRALADLLDMAQLELTGQDLHAPSSGQEHSLAALMGYEMDELPGDCQAIVQQEREFDRKEIVIAGPPKRCVERTLTPVRDPDAAIIGWLLVFRDVTEERELAQLRDDMMDMLIHDLRSPLTVLLSSLELMTVDLEQGRTEAFDDLIGLAEKSSSRLLRLVNDLLDISRLENGQMEIHREPSDLGAMLEAMADRFSPLAQQAQIEVEVSCEPDCPPVTVDAEIMDRVLHNLVDNALKFTPDGGTVHLWARPDSDQEPVAMLMGVSDNGPGISQEAQARLFRKFQQVVSNMGRRTGTGLGLPFCKLAVEAHGGDIWVESQVGQGSTFVVRLPIATP